jgi:hypothetical protein
LLKLTPKALILAAALLPRKFNIEPGGLDPPTLLRAYQIDDHRTGDWKADQRAIIVPEEGVENIASEIYCQDRDGQANAPTLPAPKSDKCRSGTNW